MLNWSCIYEMSMIYVANATCMYVVIYICIQLLYLFNTYAMHNIIIVTINLKILVVQPRPQNGESSAPD